MSTPEDRGQQIRQGLRRAVQGGRVLGGLRPARHQENQQIHQEALLHALDYSDVLEAGREKSLSALSRDLFAAGCATSKGKPLTPEMVRRLRARLEEALLAIVSGDLKVNPADWGLLLELGISTAIQQRNRVSLVWHLRMIRKEKGDTFADRVVRSLMGSEHAAWVRDVLGKS
jgi:hypothetical protein